MNSIVEEVFDTVLENREEKYDRLIVGNILYDFWEIVFLADELGKLQEIKAELQKLKEEQTRNGRCIL